MPLGKRQRKFLLGLGLITVALLVLGLALPLWFPWVLRPLAARVGAHYASYVREGYSHFKLTGFTLTNRTVRFSADKLEGLVPTTWLWRLERGTNAPPDPLVSISDWQFVSIPSGGPSPAVYAAAQDALSIFTHLKKELPIARLTNGTIHIEQTDIGVPVLNWTRGDLTGMAVLPEPAGEVTLHADVSGTPPFRLEASSEALGLRSQIRILPGAAGLEIQSTSFWRSNQVDMYAQFSRTSHIPELASVKAREFVLPAEIVHLAPYQSLQGSLAAKWERGEFGLDLNVNTLPPATQTNLPRFELELHARGDTNSATIQTAKLSAPWAAATLSRELAVHFKGPLLDRSAQLTIAADLSRQNWVPLEGQLRGEADFTPARGKWPSAGFHLIGSQVTYQSLTASNLTLAGSFDWPHLVLTNVVAQFDDGSAARANAALNLTNEVVTDGSVRISGGVANRWLQPSFSYRDLSLSASFNGPLEQLVHQGSLEVDDFFGSHIRPMKLHVKWQGRQEAIQEFQLELSSGLAVVQTQGAFTNSPAQIDLRIHSLSLLTNRERVLSLMRPVQISAAPPTRSAGWKLSSSPVVWNGPGGQLQASAYLDWPQSGDLKLSLLRVSSSVLSNFTDADWPALEIQNLNAAANWSNGPATFSVNLSGAKLAPGANAHLPTNSLQVLSLLSELSLHGNSDGVTLSNLLVYSQTSAVVTAKGFVPLTLSPSNLTNLFKINPQKPLELKISGEPHAFFWKEFTDWTGVRLNDPQLRLQLSGTWEHPLGEVELRTRELRLEHSSTNLPTFTDLKVTLQLDRTKARLADTHLLVQGQPVTLNAQIPLDLQFWADLRQKKLPNWDKASAQLRIQDAEIAAFEALFPNILAPQGTLDLDVSLAPGGKLAGELAMQNARTRPLGDFGPIRNISAKFRFLDRDLKIESVSAQISGAPLNITGQADLRGTEWLHAQLPPFWLTLRGTNVPLIRQPEAVIRSDLNLTAGKTNGSPPVIAGNVRLRDAFFLADLNALVPGKVAGPSRRPPYFSIEDPPLADWRLAVKVDGLRFLKVSTPIFNGEVSASLVLQGTLKEPIALGDLKVDSGAVRFPFASLQVQQGLITLNSQDPYHPQLQVTAASKQFGYDLHMDVTGPVDAPVIQFSSTPPLSSEQILLMVTAGQLPQGTFSLTAQQRAQTMAMFFGRDLLSKLGVGDQSQERLTIKSGEEISDQGRPTYHVEYKLTEHWSLVGEYDRFGDFNAGFKWRILSR